MVSNTEKETLSETSYLTILGFLLRDKRENLGLTREMIATKTGYSEGWVKNVESGFVAISIDRLRKLSNCLGVNASELLKVADEIKHQLEKENVIVSENVVSKENDFLYQKLTAMGNGKTGAVAGVSFHGAVPILSGIACLAGTVLAIAMSKAKK